MTCPAQFAKVWRKVSSDAVSGVRRGMRAPASPRRNAVSDGPGLWATPGDALATRGAPAALELVSGAKHKPPASFRDGERRDEPGLAMLSRSRHLRLSGRSCATRGEGGTLQT